MNKICTSLEQSQKLIELGIDIDTADMYHAPDANIIVAEPYITKVGDKTFIPAYKGAIPAWSLTALLGLIPYNVSFNKAVYRFKMVKYSNHWECYHENFGSVSTKIFKADNPIDTCYEMIIKLHELNLL